MTVVGVHLENWNTVIIPELTQSLSYIKTILPEVLPLHETTQVLYKV